MVLLWRSSAERVKERCFWPVIAIIREGISNRKACVVPSRSTLIAPISFTTPVIYLSLVDSRLRPSLLSSFAPHIQRRIFIMTEADEPAYHRLTPNLRTSKILHTPSPTDTSITQQTANALFAPASHALLRQRPPLLLFDQCASPRLTVGCQA